MIKVILWVSIIVIPFILFIFLSDKNAEKHEEKHVSVVVENKLRTVHKKQVEQYIDSSRMLTKKQNKTIDKKEDDSEDEVVFKNQSINDIEENIQEQYNELIPSEFEEIINEAEESFEEIDIEVLQIEDSVSEEEMDEI